MAVRPWSEDSNSGIAAIDSKGKLLFDMINAFEEENNTSTQLNIVATFLESMAYFLDERFRHEEGLMEREDYPLIDYHVKLHRLYRQNLYDMTELLHKKKLGEPAYIAAIRFATEWMNHVVRDDNIIFYYRKHKHLIVGDEIAGRPCEVFSLDNQLLTYGTVTHISDSDIWITCKNRFVQLWYGDVVKVSLFTHGNEFLCFASRVFAKNQESLELFKGVVLKTTNSRGFFRVPTRIDAVMSSDDHPPSSVTILDISAGGMLIETELSLELSDHVTIEFKFHDTMFTEICQVIRLLKKDANKNNYGTRFISMGKNAQNNLMKHLLRQQALHIKKYRD